MNVFSCQLRLGLLGRLTLFSEPSLPLASHCRVTNRGFLLRGILTLGRGQARRTVSVQGAVAVAHGARVDGRGSLGRGAGRSPLEQWL
jgi:hypothetical protein